MQRASLPRPGLLHSAGGLLLLPSHIDFAAQGTETHRRALQNPGPAPTRSVLCRLTSASRSVDARSHSSTRQASLCSRGAGWQGWFFFFHCCGERGEGG